MKVAVTGAGGRTGRLVIKRLLDIQDRQPKLVSGVVATVRSGDALLKIKSDLPELAVLANSVAVVDVAAAGRAAERGEAPDPDLAAALKGCDALVIATSGVPEIKKRSIAWMMIAKAIGKKGVRPSFRWKAGQEPRLVDWFGQKAQIDAALASGTIKRVVIVSSMGGTDTENMLNKIAGGQILQWKRRAEQYLVEKSAGGKVEFTILHPGGLVDTKGEQRPLAFGVDDALLKRTKRSIPRDDVARVAVAAAGGNGEALASAFKNKSLDLVCDALAEGEEGAEGEEARARAAAAAQDLGALAAALAPYDYGINDCSAFGG